MRKNRIRVYGVVLIAIIGRHWGRILLEGFLPFDLLQLPVDLLGLCILGYAFILMRRAPNV